MGEFWLGAIVVPDPIYELGPARFGCANFGNSSYTKLMKSLRVMLDESWYEFHESKENIYGFNKKKKQIQWFFATIWLSFGYIK